MTIMTLRLLSAARHAYAIARDGPVADFGTGALPPSSAAVGYVAPPVGYRAGLFNQDAGLVGSIAEGVVVSIRGTTPHRADQDPKQIVIDWACDAVAGLARAGGAPPGFPGEVHFGFYKTFMRLWQKLGPAVAAAVDAHAAKTIFVTGHSKGGAVCPLVAWRLHLDYPDHAIVVRAFAPARVGDDAFAKTYNAAIPDHMRYEFDDDVVPHLPLETDLASALGAPTVAAALLSSIVPSYGEVGTLGYIRTDGTIAPQSPALAAERLQRLAVKLASPGGLAYVAACHGMDKGTDGYVRAHYAS
jgi:hypothetical protein